MAVEERMKRRIAATLAALFFASISCGKHVRVFNAKIYNKTVKFKICKVKREEDAILRKSHRECVWVASSKW